MQRSEDISELDAEVLVTQNMQKAKDIPVTSTQPCNLAQIDNRYSNTQQRFAGSGSTLLPSCIEPPAASRNALIAQCETDPSRQYDERALPGGISEIEPKGKGRGLSERNHGPLSSKRESITLQHGNRTTEGCMGRKYLGLLPQHQSQSHLTRLDLIATTLFLLRRRTSFFRRRSWQSPAFLAQTGSKNVKLTPTTPAALSWQKARVRSERPPLALLPPQAAQTSSSQPSAEAAAEGLAAQSLEGSDRRTTLATRAVWVYQESSRRHKGQATPDWEAAARARSS